MSGNLIALLTAAGRGDDLRSVASLPGFGERASVVALSFDVHHGLRDTVMSLPVDERIALAKAIAAYEHSVGGIGSVTSLEPIIRSIPEDERHRALDWILLHTRSFAYYSHGARSARELRALKEQMARSRAWVAQENARREQQRAAEGRRRRAQRATVNLYNAVRRGDAQAVAAMLRNGATIETRTPDGTPLLDYAISLGHTEIVAQLRESTRDTVS